MAGVKSYNPEQMFDILKIRSLRPSLKGERIAMVINDAEPCVAALSAIKNK